MKPRPDLIQQNKLSKPAYPLPEHIKEMYKQKMHDRSSQMEHVIIVFADTQLNKDEMEEFNGLVYACDMEIDITFTQLLKTISFRTYIGSGKCEEIRSYIQDHPVSYVIFDHNLTPLQIRNLEECFEIPVMDRTELILTIFEKRAISPTARLQVESARLKKLLPRLIGTNTQLGRQSASGKNKGTGEKQLELDRRRIKARIHEVRRELKEDAAHRENQRRARAKSSLPLVALTGYTNAGKSTIMNRFLQIEQANEDKLILEKDMLFATLDTAIRRISPSGFAPFLLSDTVGFVRNLPHELIEAFHSTLEEITYADLIIIVLDASDEHALMQLDVTKKTLQDLGANAIPSIIIWNKCDQTEYNYPCVREDMIYISANHETSIQTLLQVIEQRLYGDWLTYTLRIPYEEAYRYQELSAIATIHSMEHKEDGLYLTAMISNTHIPEYCSYIVASSNVMK